MTVRDRLRRVVIVCASFGGNLACNWPRPNVVVLLLTDAHRQASFWRQANANFLDVAVLEWCKLFGEPKGEHGWRSIIADPVAFEASLLGRLGLTVDAFEEHVKTMRHYRDKFIAHLNSNSEMHIPMLTASHTAIRFYHEQIALREAGPGDLAGLPQTADDLARGYAQCFGEAEAIFSAAGDSFLLSCATPLACEPGPHPLVVYWRVDVRSLPCSYLKS